jgi:hypothetical protein
MLPVPWTTPLLSYAMGAVAGLVALSVEHLWLATTLRLDAAAAYSIAGGTLALITGVVLRLLWPGGAAWKAALAVGAFWTAFELTYFLNVRLLRGEHFLSLRSLTLDVLLLAAASALAIGLAVKTPVALLPYRWVQAGAGVGAALAASAALVMLWPRARTTRDARPHAEGPNLLLVVFDSARRDRFGTYGYRRPTSPWTDALAGEGRVYDGAQAASSWTVPSVEVMLGTSAAVPVAQRLRALGYATGCFTDNPHLSDDSSLMRGFDVVSRSVSPLRRPFRRTVFGEVMDRLAPSSDQDLVAKALEWAEDRPGARFLYVQLMDSHTPYRSPRIDGGRGSGRRIEFPFPGMDITPAEAEDIVARYDGGIRRADAQVGRLLAAARRWGRPFVAIVTADHGESLGESGRWFHGASLAPELLSIPLVVLGDGVRPGRVLAPVGHASIMPTLLAAAGAACGHCAGSDLRASEGDPVVEGELPPYLRYRIANGYKLVVDERTHQRRLFALTDTTEAHDLSRSLRTLVAAMGDDLDGTPGQTPPSEELKERLRALRYFGPASPQ